VAAEIMRTAAGYPKSGASARMARKIKGPLLVNSFASWPLAIDLLGRHEGPACWYIHESYEPGVMMTFRKPRPPEVAVRGGEGPAALRRRRDACALGASRLRWRRALLERHPDVAFTGGAPRSIAPQGKRRVILNVGTVGARKGTIYLLEAFA